MGESKASWLAHSRSHSHCLSHSPPLSLSILLRFVEPYSFALCFFPFSSTSFIPITVFTHSFLSSMSKKNGEGVLADCLSSV